jgi:hypothetical protein
MTKEPKPPTTTLNIHFVGPDGDKTDKLTVEIPASFPKPVTYDGESWSEATAFDEFCKAIRESNSDQFCAARLAFERLKCWPAVWEQLSRLPNVDDSFRQNFRSRVAISGFHFRQSVQDLTVVIRAFRHLLPRYSGPSQKLFRGELLSKHEQRDYGFSWTPSTEVARMFANRRQAVDGEPGVLLESIAPAEAIISGPIAGASAEEHEHIVDPNALEDIRVIG